MKKAIIASASVTLLYVVMTGCGGGSGTPLPSPAKTGAITFAAISSPVNPVYTAAFETRNLLLPSGLSVQLQTGSSSIIAVGPGALEALQGQSFGSSYFPNFTGTGVGRVILTINANNTSNDPLIAGDFARLTCTLNDGSKTFSQYTSGIRTLNQGLTLKAYGTQGLSSYSTSVRWRMTFK